jgi:hypothetical protein
VAVRVIATAAGDAERRNDTLSTVLDVHGAPTAVFVSTAPDQDARFALDLLRGALRIGVRAFVRVAPGQWREEGSLARVDESVVRTALGRAGVALLHGDTALFGAPRAVTRGALALIVPPREDDGEYFTERAGPSPLSPALSGVPWDSLPPISVGPSAVGTSWGALSARRARRFDDRVVVAGYDEPRRVIVLPIRGLWRWKFRGGRAADAYAALWGGVIDWLVQGDVDERAARAASPWLREGEPVTWRHGGAGRDTMVEARLRRDGTADDLRVTLRFSAAGGTATSPPLSAGVWRATVGGGVSAFAVNTSAEWVPRRPIAARAAVAGAATAGAPASLRTGWWWYALVLGMLSVEWWMRRSIGLR